jgi:hypothetical protein
VCWGNDNSGQVSAVPTGQFHEVNAGQYNGCAIQSLDNSVVCWGSNSYGIVSGTP